VARYFDTSSKYDGELVDGALVGVEPVEGLLIEGVFAGFLT
jgi:hypothetical protein